MVTADVVLAARGLHKRLGRRNVLRGLDLDVRSGEAVGVCGANGVGKTTLVRILAGILRADAGGVSRGVATGYAPQAPLLYEQLTPREHFLYVAAARGIAADVWRTRADALLDRYRFVAWADQPVASLSGGTRQKLNLALALIAKPALLLLDEPYGGFEWETYLRFWDHVAELRRSGHSIVVISHLFYDQDRLDRLLELRDGRVVEVP